MRLLFSVLLAWSLLANAADQDTQALKNYRLSMPVLQKLHSINNALVAAQANNPAQRVLAQKKTELAKLEQKDQLSDREQQQFARLADEIDRLEENISPGINLNDAQSLSDLERQITAQPALAEALRQSGLSAREYATAMLVIVQTGLAYGLMQSGLLKQAPADVAGENLKFFRDHESEIAALTVEANRDDASQDDEN